MIPFLADENFNADIIRGLRRREPKIDLVTVQMIGFGRASDATVLERAAAEGRLVVTHDLQTLPGFAYERVKARLSLPGVIAVPMDLAIGVAIQDILTVEGASERGEWEGQIIYQPL